MSAEAFSGLVIEHFGGCVLESLVHALGLAAGPGMIRLGQPVFDAMLFVHAIEWVVSFR